MFLDYGKPFDSIDQQKILLLALADCRVYHQYINIAKKVYETVTPCVKLHEDTEKLANEYVVRKRDTISSK